jgi:hypothetical protein
MATMGKYVLILLLSSWFLRGNTRIMKAEKELKERARKGKGEKGKRNGGVMDKAREGRGVGVKRQVKRWSCVTW